LLLHDLKPADLDLVGGSRPSEASNTSEICCCVTSGPGTSTRNPSALTPPPLPNRHVGVEDCAVVRPAPGPTRRLCHEARLPSGRLQVKRALHVRVKYPLEPELRPLNDR
jgi:hypothetical protein